MPADRDALIRGNLYQLVGTFCWASAFPATQILLATWHPLPLATARIGGGALVLLLVLAATGGLRRLPAVPWREVVVLGVVGFVGGAGLIVAGQAFADPVTAAVLATSIPLISAIMGLVERTEPMTARLALGITLAVMGGVLVSVAPLDSGLGFRGGELLILLSQVFWAFFSRRAVTAFADLEPVARAALPMAAGAVMLLLITLTAGLAGAIEPRFELEERSVALLVWIATAGIGLSVTLWLVSSQLLGVTIASMHVNLGPFYVMLIMLAAGGAILVGQVAGAALVATGALVAQLGKTKGGPPAGMPGRARGSKRL